MQPLVVVLGPTGSGKTDLALHVAQIFDGEVVSCDSLQIYRHFDIGTARTPLSERCGVPHHLIDLIEPDQIFTAGDYARAGRSALADISARGKLPVVAGGTGFIFGLCSKVCSRDPSEMTFCATALPDTKRIARGFCTGCCGGWTRRRRRGFIGTIRRN